MVIRYRLRHRVQLSYAALFHGTERQENYSSSLALYQEWNYERQGR